MLVFLFLVFVLLVIVIWYRNNDTCKPKPHYCGMTPEMQMLEAAPPMETSMVELETSCRPSSAHMELPDLVGNMWNTENSMPDIDKMGRYVTSWNSDFETPTWNRFSLSKSCGGVRGMSEARSPSKTVEFS